MTEVGYVRMTDFDVIVIGGGPAGMMAAGTAAVSGAKTTLLEKMDQPGRKLRITGKGRCNLTNSTPLEDFIAHFGENGRFLYSAFSRFFNTELTGFMRQLGIQTVEERGGRIFPIHDDAQEIVSALEAWMVENGVVLQTRAKVENLIVENDRLVGAAYVEKQSPALRSKSGGDSIIRRSRAHAVILATGGASYPGTGSTGDGYRLAASVGHTIVPIRPALVPLEIEGDLPARLQGLSLRNVNLRFLHQDDAFAEAFGEMLFTHFGVSGPIVLSQSLKVVDALRAGRRVELSIDLKPALDDAKLDARLLRDLDTHGKRQFQTILKDLLPHKLIPVCIDLVGIPARKPAHQITADERQRLRTWLKDFRLSVSGHRSFREAIVTAGGIDLREVDPRTMGSKLVDGLYFAGEVLDLDADTGGYNLQAAFSTGWLAGKSAADS
ncbi:MAG: NAD(P)/FAD-dependent oxidoreductase [Anaerolineales bacterium]